MAVLLPEDFTKLEHLATHATDADALPVKDVRVSAGAVLDGIQTIQVDVTIDVSETDGWDTSDAKALRRQVHDAIVTALGEDHPEASYTVTTFLRPRLDSD